MTVLVHVIGGKQLKIPRLQIMTLRDAIQPGKTIKKYMVPSQGLP